MVTTRRNKRKAPPPPPPPPLLPANADLALDEGAPLFAQGGLSFNQQKKLFQAIEDAGGLFKLSSTKPVLDADPRTFGGPNSDLRRQFRNRIQVVKNQADPRTAAEGYYGFLSFLGVTPNLSGEARSRLTTEDEDDAESTRSSSVSPPPPQLPLPALPSGNPWGSPQRLHSTPQLPTPPSFLHQPLIVQHRPETTDDMLVNRMAALDMSMARFDFDRDESVDEDTKQQIRGKCVVSRASSIASDTLATLTTFVRRCLPSRSKRLR